MGNPSMRQTPVPNVSFDVYTRTGSMGYRRRQRFDNAMAPRLLPFKREVRGFPLFLQEDRLSDSSGEILYGRVAPCPH
jgi:hypothetical protein